MLSPIAVTMPSRSVITADQRTNSYAVFGQATVPLGSDTNLTGGIRYTIEKRSIAGQINLTLANGFGFPAYPGGLSQEQTFRKPTWRVSLDHQFGDVLGYASYNRGFKSGGFNPQLDGTSFKPEVLDAYELGAKATLLGNRLRFNPAFFYYDYSNIQVPLFEPSGQVGITNGPKSTIYGLDLDFEFAVTPRLRLSGGATVMHDRFTTYPGAVYDIPLATGGSFQTTGNATGHRLPFTADWATSFVADYRIYDGSAGKASINVAYNHNDGFYSEADNLRRQNAYNLVNSSLSVTPQGSKFTVRGWVKNLTNDAVVTLLAGTAFGTGAQYQPPRTYGFTLQAGF